MTWPASDVNTTNADSSGDNPGTFRADVLDLIQKFNQMRNHVSTLWKTILSGGAYTPSKGSATYAVHSATPVIDASIGNVHELPAMTSNITSMTISSTNPGQAISVRLQQDGTGGRSCALPAGAVVAGSINTGAGKVSWLNLIHSERSGVLEGAWLNLP